MYEVTERQLWLLFLIGVNVGGGYTNKIYKTPDGNLVGSASCDLTDFSQELCDATYTDENKVCDIDEEKVPNELTGSNMAECIAYLKTL